jgi:hypothetical protein
VLVQGIGHIRVSLSKATSPIYILIYILRAFIFGGIFGGIFLFPLLLSPSLSFLFPPLFMELAVNPADAPCVAEEAEEHDVDSSNDDSEGGDAARREGGFKLGLPVPVSSK